MCYILHGAMDRAADNEDYARIACSQYTFKLGTKHDIKMSVAKETYDFRVTDGICDCEFPIGEKDENAVELKELAELFLSMRTVKNAKSVYLCKTWSGKQNKQEIKVHIDDVDILSYLANMKVNCLYQIDLL